MISSKSFSGADNLSFSTHVPSRIGVGVGSGVTPPKRCAIQGNPFLLSEVIKVCILGLCIAIGPTKEHTTHPDTQCSIFYLNCLPDVVKQRLLNEEFIVLQFISPCKLVCRITRAYPSKYKFCT